jgi:vanillate O-demethylase ferredoxin subunit
MANAMGSRRLIDVRVHAIGVEAEGIFSFDLRPVSGTDLPPFPAGSHINLLLKNALERSYSLINPAHEIHRYMIAVARAPQSSGGSQYICESLRVGDTLRIAEPHNNFALDESAKCSVLVAGGIGITPIWSLLQRLQELGKPWKLFYAARTRQRMAFLSRLLELNERYPDAICLSFDHEPGYSMLDLPSIIQDQVPGAHFYCCGPAGMLQAFEAAAAKLDPATIHIERFSSALPPAQGGFEVRLAKSHRSFFIPPDKTILEVLLSEGLQINHSCMQGVCGTCETCVLEGLPDHRDSVLSKRERESNKVMMICCSGARSGKLVLDL